MYHHVSSERSVEMAKKTLNGTTDQQRVETTGARPAGGFWGTLGRVFLRQREASVIIVAIVLIIYFQISNNNFLTLQNIPVLAQYTAATAIIAAGEVMLLICGEIDLSVGETYAFAPYIMYFAYQAGIPIVISIILGLLASAVIGLVNGWITVYLKVPSLITTLGTLFFVEGITLIISGAMQVATPEVPGVATIMGNSAYAEIIWAIAIVIVMQIVLSWTRWGVHTVAIGSNPVGASEVGININKVKIGNFVLTALFAGFSGILDSFYVTTINPPAAISDIMLTAIAGAVIGGTVLQGGSGTIIGAFLGTFVLSILNNGFTLLGANAYVYDAILGLAILIAMVLNVRLQMLRKAGRE
jgi:simple sugar transport system permease protein